MSSQLISWPPLSNWVHIRNWPLVIRTLTQEIEDPAILLGLKLHELVERLTAQEFFLYEIDVIESKIVEYLELRRNLRLEYSTIMPSAKPKHHFLR